MGKKLGGSGTGMNNLDHRYFLELGNHFVGLKYFNSLMRIRDEIRILDAGWKKVGSGINIPDPQHWGQGCKYIPYSVLKFLFVKGLISIRSQAVRYLTVPYYPSICETSKSCLFVVDDDPNIAVLEGT